MIENWDKSFAEVLKSEGGYVNDPHDHGGETNLGVTKAAWAAYIKRPVQDGEMKALTPDIVKPFYKTEYWDKCKCDSLPSGVDYLVFDLAVNGGVLQWCNGCNGRHCTALRSNFKSLQCFLCP